MIPVDSTYNSSPKISLLKFDRNDGTHDWNYPFELCATLFRKVRNFLFAIFPSHIFFDLFFRRRTQKLFSKQSKIFTEMKVSPIRTNLKFVGQNYSHKI